MCSLSRVLGGLERVCFPPQGCSARLEKPSGDAGGETVSPISVHVAQIIRWQLGDVKWILLYFSFLPQPSGRHPYTFSVPPVISLGP